jgi:hypothetical protein
VMEKEQLVRGCEKILEEFAEYGDVADEIMTTAVRHAIGAEAWIGMSESARTEAKRDLFRAFKAGFNAKFVEDHMTREDLEHLKQAKLRLQRVHAFLQDMDETQDLQDEVSTALAHITVAIQPTLPEPTRETSIIEPGDNDE